MKKPNYVVFIEDVLESMDKIARYINGLDYDTFIKNELVVDAVLRNLEIIGEASRNIPENIREKYPDIPWKRMIGLRNIIIHDYFGVDSSIIWKIVTTNLSETKPKIKSMFKNFS